MYNYFINWMWPSRHYHYRKSYTTFTHYHKKPIHGDWMIQHFFIWEIKFSKSTIQWKKGSIWTILENRKQKHTASALWGPVTARACSWREVDQGQALRKRHERLAHPQPREKKRVGQNIVNVGWEKTLIASSDFSQKNQFVQPAKFLQSLVTLYHMLDGKLNIDKTVKIK